MDKPLVIFDYDGVLVDTTEFLEEQVHLKLAELGYDIPWSVDEMRNLFDENIIVALIEKGLSPRDMCTIWEHIQKVSQGVDVRLCKGVEPMLAALASKCSMAVISSNSTQAIRDVLSKKGILQSFFMVSGGDEEMGKVERMRRCMQSCGTKIENTFYVGDTVGDVREAHEAGIAAIAAAWGLHPAERLAGAQPEMIINDPSELVDFVNALAPQG
ncbi:MAG: HAD hydrolase-like protein [Proteobacteria bacterium]|nr:HAD hydrolase-like protein [Pseudomonadota bacterium]